MKRVLLFASAMTLFVVGVSVTAFASSNSGIAACETTYGLPPDICATCLNPSTGGGYDYTGSAAPCVCKQFVYEDPTDFYAEFANLGACVNYVQAVLE